MGRKPRSQGRKPAGPEDRALRPDQLRRRESRGLVIVAVASAAIGIVALAAMLIQHAPERRADPPGVTATSTSSTAATVTSSTTVPPAASAAEFVGQAACASCHPGESEAWKG